ncbi:MAG: FecR domain-containing protein [Pseudomonadota bacterium]
MNLSLRYLQGRPGRALLLGVVFALASPLALAAQAGKALFVAGTVTIETGNRALHAGDPVNVGDTVVTGPASRAQLLMGDGARIALRAGSRFRVDAFELGAGVRDPGSATVAAATGRSVSTLLKGGFHTTSGSIGKGDPAAYEVRVPIGTLGIRGTDYVAVFCRGDCSDAPGLKPGEPVRDGLYLGVYSGSIAFRGSGLDLTLAAGEFLFIPLPSLTPEPQHEPPPPTQGDGAGPLTLRGTQQGSQGGPASKGAITRDVNAPAAVAPDAAPPATNTVLPVEGEANGRIIDLTPGRVPKGRGSAYVGPPLPTLVSPSANVASDALYQFGAAGGSASMVPVTSDLGSASLRIGTALASDTGTDATSGLSWGRWSGGSVYLVDAAGNALAVPLGVGSVHWISGAGYLASQPPVLPVSGRATYGVVGATSPTDSAGTVGKFGGAWLNANFTARTVDAVIALQLGNLEWYGTATAQPIQANLTVQGTFSGSVANVSPLANAPFSAVFTASADPTATLPVIAMSYALGTGGAASRVEGVVALAPNANAGTPTPPALGARDVAIAFSNDLGNGEAGQAGVATNAVGQYKLQGAAGVGVDPVQLGSGGATITMGTASVAEAGTDPTTMIRWGRWSGGAAQISSAAAGVTNLDLTSRSLHWVLPGDFGATPVAMPITGSRTYDVVGSTQPTDALGSAGTLGSLTLAADFSKNSVTTDLALTISNTTWVAQGTGSIGASANLPAQQFTGAFTAPTIGGVVQAAGGGQFNGFFTNLPGQTSGAPGGAGMSYFLTAPGAGVVSGAAALVGR